MAEELPGSAAGTVERRAEIYKDATTLAGHWLNALSVAEKTESDWRDKAEKAVKIYRAETRPAFNVLHANVETIVPALYNSTPIPDVRTRHADPNEAARQAGQVLERALAYQLDQYDFDASVRSAVLDMQVAGRGIVRVRYRPYTRTEAGVESVVWQEAICEHVPWKSFRRGPGESWAKVPWVAFETFPTRDELITLAGEEVGGDIPLDATEGDATKDEGREASAFRRAKVWEIWDKETRRVYFICPGYPKGPIAAVDDPEHFLDFFPCPSPLQALSDPETMVPITPYEIYRKQAEELNTVSERILRLVEVLKYRGIRASEVPEIEQVEHLEDGQFAPSSGALSAIGGGVALQDAIWVVPIEKLVVVIRELIVQREQIKQAIYEITGIADILRGSTNAAETATAQQIKAQWGSLRVQGQQREVQRFCRDLFRLKAEIIASRFTPDTLAMVNGAPVAPEVLEVLRSDVRRTYLVDVETDSTIRADLTRSQENMAQFLNGTAQFFGTFAPLIQSNTLPPQVAQVAVTLYGAFTRQFKLGKAADDALASLEKAAKEMPLGQPSPEQQEVQQIGKAKAVAEVEKVQAEAAKTKTEADLIVRQYEDQRRDVGLTDGHAIMGMADALAGSVAQMQQAMPALVGELQQVADAVRSLAAMQEAPVEAIRGPDGKIAAVRKGDLIRQVTRDAEGRATGLQ